MFHSITHKINAIFLIVIFLLSILFALVIVHERGHVRHQLFAHHKQTFSYIRKHKKIFHHRKNIVEFLKTQNYKIVKNKKILKEAKSLYGKHFGKKHFVKFFELDGKYYVKNRFLKFVLQDTQVSSSHYKIILIFIALLATIVLMYISILKSFRPLKLLQSKIVQFGNGDLEVSFKSNKKDEIAKVSNEFENTKNKIISLLESRKLFLHSVMHELKTPIAKGMIVSEMTNDETQKPRLENIFKNMDYIINEFGQIEEIISTHKKLDLKEQNASELVDKAKQLLLDDEENVEININSDFELKADENLLLVAIKNLLQNAISYSPNQKATLKINNQTISILNKGEPLKEPINQYFKPFHYSSKGSFGLGLYIVKHILDLHNLKLKYKFESGENSFEIS